MSQVGVPPEVETAVEAMGVSWRARLGPILAIDAASMSVVYASAAAMEAFGAADAGGVAREAVFGDSPGAKRFRQLARMLAAGATPRTERLRFFLRDRFETLTWRIGRAADSNLLVAVLDEPVPLRAGQLSEAESSASFGSLSRERSSPREASSALPETRGDSEAGRHRDDLTRRFGGSALRFLWRTDSQGAVMALSGPFCAAVGLPEAEILGRNLAEAAKAAGADPDGRLLRALASAATWSKVDLAWPLRGVAAAAPVSFGAVPAFAPDKGFEGWRGFGVIDLAGLFALPAAAAAPGCEDEPVAVKTPEPDESGDALVFGANVVAFRNGVAPSARGSALTRDERLAFEEIARALIRPAPPEAAGVSVDGGAEPLPEQPASAIAETAPDQQTGEPAGGAPARFSESICAALAASPMAAFVSRGLSLLWANPALLALAQAASGPEAAETLAPTLRDLCAENAGAAELRRLALRRRGGETLVIETSSHVVDWEGEPATLSLARPAVGSGSARARQLESELRLRDAEARELHSILDTATDGVAVLDADARLVSLNRAGEALFDCDQNDVAGEPFVSLLAADSHAPALEYFHQVASNGVGSLLNDGREIVGRARRGGAIPIFMTLGRVNSGAATKFCAVLRDMTAWKKVERELKDARSEAERASALKSDFLAKVSHEIRTPLNAILGFAEVIMDERFGPVGNERYRDYLKDIHASGTHVMSLVNDLLDLSKIEAGKMELKFENVDANKIVAECVSIMQPQANSERVIVRLSTAAHLPRVLADERSLRQIVLNLLSNAVKFNEPGGQVIVSTALTDAGHAVIRIRDTGIGMSESELVTALEPFRQVQTSRQTSGTGLGLPLTKALVEANRASFIVKSKKAEGTLVEVTFPPARVMAE